jgi:hypothetical protein
MQIRFSRGVQRHSIKIPKAAMASIHTRLLAGLHGSPVHRPSLSPQEQDIVRSIHEQTIVANQNNVTRTEAYRQIYFRHPELHWAFLAHMVSRNGGWNMTDLKGELLSRLMGDRERTEFFLFLERCNSLIFQDAYPQLLLYEESMQRNTNLSKLLPEFFVSNFMKPFWDDFWLRKDPAMLTLALIVNEQNYIEGRVVQNFPYKQHVLNTLQFKMQSLFQLTQVFFPYRAESREGEFRKGKISPGESRQDRSNRTRLAGIHLENFSDLNERIQFGKQLYAILFGIPQVHQTALEFAKRVPHTGSRADYWPDLFTAFLPSRQESTSQGSGAAGVFPRYRQERLVACRLQSGAPPFYSPRLEDAWQDQTFQVPDRRDWFRDDSPLQHFVSVRAPVLFDMTDNFCLELNKLELAVLALEPWREN